MRRDGADSAGNCRQRRAGPSALGCGSAPITASGSQVTICGNTVISAMQTTRQTKNGIAARAIVLLSLPVMFCSTNRLKPTGGVTSAISTSSTMKMPNQTRSKPAFWIIGSTTARGQHDHRDAVERGAEHDVDDGQHGDQRVRATGCSASTHSASSRGMPVKAIVLVRNDGAGEDEHDHAARRASRPSGLPRSCCQVSEPARTPAIASEPSTP